MSSHHVCPWWLAYTFDNPLRRLIHDPHKILAGYLSPGMTVMDIGCGMGYFTLAMAEIVGDDGRVIALDLQPKMLKIMMKRARRKGLAHRIAAHLTEPDRLNISTPTDFALAFWMVHETPDPEKFFTEVAASLKPAANMLYTEPGFHVSENRYHEILAAAERCGLQKTGDISIRFSHAALLKNRI